jgi:MFS family permease
MTQILARLSAVNLALLLAALLGGWLSQARGGLTDPADPVYPLHQYLGLFAVVFNLGVHCLIFIYFLGTGRWVKEVAAAYGLPDEPWPKRTRQLKRRTFPPSLLAMLLPIGVAAAGMAQLQHRAEWAPALHTGLAILAVGVNVWALRVAYRDVRTNGELIDAVMREVDRIRAERGLPTSAEAWEQQT